jgi:Mn2+/Fe2+ NRAMP family transporter
MKFEYNISFEDILSYNLYLNHNHVSLRKSRKTIKIFAILFLVFGVLAFLSGSTLLVNLSIWLIIFSLYLFLVPTILKISLKRKVKNIYKRGQNLILIGQHKINITDSHIFDETDYSESKISWQAIEGIDEDDQFIYILTTSFSAIFIPKNIFSDESEKIDFLNTINDYRIKNMPNHRLKREANNVA